MPVLVADSSEENIVLCLNKDFDLLRNTNLRFTKIEPVICYTVFSGNQLNVTKKQHRKIHKVNTMQKNKQNTGNRSCYTAIDHET